MRGETSPREAEVLEQHVDGCTSCQALLETLDSADDLVRIARAAPPRVHQSEAVDRLIVDLVGLVSSQVTTSEPREASQAKDPLDLIGLLSPPQSASELGYLGRFRILSILGRGGMGIVFRAEDTTLGRPVALKILHPHYASRSTGMHRFLREAQAAAKLKHPTIVPVHEVGEHGSLAYIIYELILGSNLSTVLKAGPIPFHSLAEWVASIAEALDQAHRQGIVHRDVKPANILIDSERRPYLTDFGLAIHGNADSTLTREGDLLGTPAYMSPEQARGSHDKVDIRTDIYSLGVTLYEGLTGKTPFLGTPSQILAKILHEEPANPRSIRAEIPMELETICLKAMAKEPADRYPTAIAFAEDLRRFVRQEPITARRPGMVALFGRWCRRELKSVPLIAGIALGMILGFIGLVWLAQQHDLRLQAQFEADLRELENDLEFIDREEFESAPRMDQPRLLFLKKLAHKCQALAANRGSHPNLLRRRAEVQSHLASLQEILGRHESAEKAYRETISLRGQLVENHSGDARDVLLFARAYRQLASTLAVVGRFDEAESLYRSGLQTLRNDTQDNGADQRAELAEILDKLGELESMTGRYDDGEKSLREALTWKQQLATEFPARADWQYSLAETESQLARWLGMVTRLDEAEHLSKSAIDRIEKLVAEHRSAPRYQLGLAKVHGHHAQLLVAMGKTKETGPSLARAYELFKKLVQEHPHRPIYQIELASAQHDVARYPVDHGTRWDDNAIAEMIRLYRDAIAEQERLAAEYPAHVENQRRLGVTLNTFATYQCDMGMYAGVAAARKFNPTEAARAAELNAEALDLHGRSHAIWMKLAADHPKAIVFQNGLARSDQRYSIILRRFGRIGESDQGLRRSLAIQKKLAEAYPMVMSHRTFLCGLTHNLASSQDRMKHIDQAEALLRESRNHALIARTINPRHPLPKIQITETTKDLADVLLKLGRYREAAPLVRQFGTSDYYAWYTHKEVFPYFTRCWHQLNADFSLPATERSQLDEQYAGWMFEQIRLMSEKNPSRPQDALAEIERDPNLQPFRDRPAFQELEKKLRQMPSKRS